jgi:hypothetical protein
MRDDLPSGTVTLLLTDVEGSTRLLHELGAEACAELDEFAFSEAWERGSALTLDEAVALTLDEADEPRA